ncbi:ABC transporter substrate-binding protein [bacterium]|jgi:putative tryptophan/tyrosine transport system substrate-binding protein|nr:ABC transporter substrate-binding protein [bacterium]
MNTKMIVFMVLFCLPSCFLAEKKKIGQNTADKEKKYCVAILTPTTHPSLEKIEKGFKETLQQNSNKNITFKTYNANGSKTLMLSQAKDTSMGKFDLIFTIAAGPTIMAKEALLKTQTKTPIVFAAVSNPEEYGIKQSEINQITGITDQYNPELQAQALKLFKPNAKNMLIIYDPSQTPQLEKDSNTAKKEFEKNGMSVIKAEIFNIGDLARKVPSSIKNIDTILVLIDNTIVSGANILIKECNRNSITLLASDLDTGTRGAAIAVGVDEKMYGINAAQMAYKVLFKKIPANTIAYSPLCSQKIQVNTKTMKSQGLQIDKKTLLLLEKGQTQQGNLL